MGSASTDEILAGSDATLDALFITDAVAARVVPIRGARNLRDMGGYPTQDGRRVKRGVLFRGGHPGDIAADDIQGLHRLGLRGHVDLRTNSERAAHGFPADLVAAAGCWTRDYDLSGGDIKTILNDPAATGEAMRERMIALYRRFPQEQHEGIAAMFRLLLDGQVPLLVNCTAGKDRTGVTCALLLSALGVPREIVRRDYALTETLHHPSAHLFGKDANSPFALTPQIQPAVWQAMMRSPPEYIDATFEVIEREHGGIGAYLAANFGLSEREVSRLQELLLED